MLSRQISVLAIAAALLIAPASRAQPPAFTSALAASGLNHPLFVTFAPGDPSRLFVVEQPGRIRIVQNGTLLATPFLDITALLGNAPNYLEYGLLGLAFHPDYQHNGVFYVVYTPGTTTVADWLLARYQVSANPNIANANSRTTVLLVTYTIRQHRAGWIAFGPDGYLYATTGDGGEGDPTNAAASLSVLRGKVLRLDVDGLDNIPGNADDDGFPSDANKNYQIPPGNPFVGSPGTALPEIWAYGLRNPWRAAFDRVTGDLWIADVGQSAAEEIDFQPASSHGGENYGWRCKEGNTATGYSGCTPPLPSSVAPIHAYGHNAAGVGSVTGGYVYRGCAIPALRGWYFFADWSFSKGFLLQRHGDAAPDVLDRTTSIAPGGATSIGSPSSFGEDYYGEIYYCRYSLGDVYKIVPSGAPAAACPCKGDLNCDGLFNNFDIDAFVQRLIDPAAYLAAFPTCNAAAGDLNGDGLVNNFDIDPFVAALVANAGCQ